uniref:Chloroplast protein-transporting ATPase n=1 Tax=Panagrolaimus davidi TaxID=227884 RepID=A0A914PJ29_9BILA
MPPEEAASDIENISELLAFAEKEDSISKDQITFTHADIKIDEFVRLEWSIDEALGHFFESVKDAKTAGDRDTTFVIMAYANRMMKSFSQKTAEFIDDLIESKNEKEIGNFYAYLEEVAISEIEIPLVDYMKTLFGEEKFASNILALNEIHGCCKKDVILRTVSTTTFAITGNLQLLTFNIMHVELCDNREISGNQFQQRLTRYIERDSGIKGADIIENIDKVPENEETLRQALVQLFKYFIPDKKLNSVKESLKLLCDEFSLPGARLLNTLNIVFGTEGCYVDIERIAFIIDTVFDNCMKGNYRQYLFASILLNFPQHEWLNEFFIINIEDSLCHKIRRTGELKVRLSKISDERLKILCCEKLRDGKHLSEESLFELLHLLKDAKLVYPELRTVEIKKWPEVIQGTHVYNLLRTQKCLLNEKETKLALFWCCKIAEVFGVQEAVGVFAVLASQYNLGSEETPLTTDLKKHGGKMKVSLSILGRLVQRLCNNEIATGLKPVSPADVFWTIWSSIEGADTLPNAPNEEMKFSALPEVAAELLTPPEELKPRELNSILKMMKKDGEKCDAFEKSAFLLSGKQITEEKKKKKEESINSKEDSEEESDEEPPPGYHGVHTWQQTTTRYDPYRNCYITETKTYTGNQFQSPKQNIQKKWEREQRRQMKELEQQQKLQQKQWEKQQKQYQKEVERQNKEAIKQQKQYQKAVIQQQKQYQNQMMEQMKQQMRNMGMQGYAQILVNGQPVQVNLDDDEDKDEDEEEEDEEDNDDDKEEAGDETDESTTDDEEQGEKNTKEEKKNAAKLEKSITECMKLVNGKSTPDQLKESFKTSFPENTDNDLAMLLMVDEMIFQTRGFRLRDNQKLAVLCALKSKESILQQIATGEGKSLIIAAISIISALKGHTVNIVTSSSTLAKRDVESPAPKGCTDLYAAFGISAAHICVEDSGLRQSIYASSNIIYGDLTSFQRDYLLDTFYGMNIVGGRKFDIILVDEVDSMLLDQGSNMLYLSHEIPDFELLQPLFVRIWQIINAAVSSQGNIEFATEAVYRKVYDTMFYAIDLTQLEGLFGCTDYEAKNLRTHLLRDKIVELDGRFTDESANAVNARIELISNEVSKSLKDRLQFVVRQIFDQQKLFISKHLHNFIRQHLKEYVENAKSALFMKEGEGYQIDCAHMNSSISYEPRVIIVEQGTGVDLPTTQWSNGLHQFLQLKHGCRLSAVSLKAVFISNVSFLKKFEHLYGFSGTLGASAERLQLSTMYNLDCISIPSSLPKLLYEECSIVSDSINEWITHIFEALLEKLKANRSVYVICESIRQVNTLSSAVKSHARKVLQKDGNFMKHFENLILYRRDRENFEYGSGTKDLECGRIIFSTNLAGRGTDIKLCKDLAQNGGLHVIVAFLPDNIRVEEQAFRRAARCGEPGTAQLIVLNDSENLAHISRLKIHRNAEEVKRIQAVSTFYENSIKVEEDCFEQFAATFKGLSAQMDTYEGIETEMKQLLSRDLLDRWACWLDSQPKEGINGEMKIAKATEFVQTLNCPNQKPLRPLNRVQCGVLNAIAGKHVEAANDFDYVIFNFPDASTEAKYYKGFTIIKQTEITGRNDPAFIQVKQLFDSARRGFQARSEGCQMDKNIIETYRQRDNQTRFSIDLFSQQQSEIVQLMQIFSSSIDGLLGGRIDSHDFVHDVNSEEAAFKVYEGFKNSGPIEGLQFAGNFDESNIESFCKTNFISDKKVLNVLKKGLSNSYDFGFIEQPILEDFWEELTQKNFITEIVQHVFLNTTKIDGLNPAMADLLDQCVLKKSKEEISVESKTEDNEESHASKRVFMNFMVSLDEKTRKELNLTILYSVISHDGIEMLKEIGVLLFTQSADLNQTIENEKVCFSKYSTMTEEDLHELCIPSVDVSDIFENLCKNGILLKHQKFYNLSVTANFENSGITQCYAPIVEQIMKIRFAYILAYRTMRIAYDEKQQIKIQLPTRREASATIFDLVDSGVFEYVNVNFKALKGESHVSSVLNNAQSQLTSYLQASPSSNKVINNYDKIDSSATQIFQQFKNKSGIDKYETVDAKLIEIWKKMGDANLASLRDTFLYTSHIATHIIEYTEKKWSKKMIWKLAGVFAAAIGQLIVGGAISMFTAGAGVFASKFFISEGISDLIFVLKGACTGYAGSYWEHKKASMISSGLMCGVGALISYGSHFNSIAHSLVGPCKYTADGAQVMSLAGKAMFSQCGGVMKVIWATIKEVGKQIITALANLAVFTVIQQALQGLIKTAIAKARQYIMNFLTSMGTARLKETLLKVIKELGISAGSQLASKSGTYVFSSKNKIDTFLGKACDYIFNKYRHIFIGVCSGIQQGASQAGNIAASVLKAISYIPKLLMAGQLTQMIQSMISKLSGIHDQIEVVINAEFKAKQIISEKFASSNSKATKKIPSEAEAEEACQKLLDQWQSQLAQEVDTAIEQRITTPLLSMLASKVEGYIESAVKATYEKVMEWKDESKLAAYKKEYEAEKGKQGENEKAAWKHYEKKLNALMETTRSPNVMKEIIANCSKIDQTCASAAGAIIANIIHGPVKMIIKDENGNYFEKITDSPPEATQTIFVDLKPGHFGSQTYQSGKNSCLFDALSATVPAFHNAIHNDTEFRAILGNVITHDPYYKLHISSGWHSIAVQQKHIGGAIKEIDVTTPEKLEAAKLVTTVPEKMTNVKSGEVHSEKGRTKGRKPYISEDGNIVEYETTKDNLRQGSRAVGPTEAGKQRAHYICIGLDGCGDKSNHCQGNPTVNMGQNRVHDQKHIENMKGDAVRSFTRLTHDYTKKVDTNQTDLYKIINGSPEHYKTIISEQPHETYEGQKRDVQIFKYR